MLDLTAVVSEVVNEYGEEVRTETVKIARDIAPEIVDRLRTTSPRSSYAHEHYADSWTFDVKTDSFGTVRVTVYNKDHWQLTHLLENEHEMIAHGKHIGRSKAQKHIKPAQDWAVEEIMRELEKRL